MMLDWLRKAVEAGASDIFIGAGRCVSFKIKGTIVAQEGPTVIPREAERLISDLYELARRPMDKYRRTGDDDFPVSVPGLARFRVNTYYQRSTMAAIVRVVLFSIPSFDDMQIPPEIMNIATETHGLVLVTGPVGSGKSTTIACIVDAINKTRNCHIITLEDPIEFLHRDNKSLVSQREVSTDTESYKVALHACLRQVPDVILLGEMRDHEIIGMAIAAAETGHLVLSTMHTVGAVNTIDRIIDLFPPEQQHQIRIQLSTALKLVASQRLITAEDGSAIPAFEILRVNATIGDMIRDNKTHEISSVMHEAEYDGMVNLDDYILSLYKKGGISKAAALDKAMYPERLEQMLGG
jgi:twitching motility protein PilT